MKAQTPRIVSFGDLIMAVFDRVVQLSADPREFSPPATLTISQMPKHALRTMSSLSRLTSES
jgi:hypothetical protein